MNPRSHCICYALAVTTLWLTSTVFAQISEFPYIENFDSVVVPNLPTGWSSTQNRTPGTNDFVTSPGTPLSAPNCIVSTNATINQNLLSPLFDFRNQSPDRLTFHTRRTATHLARVVIEASTDGGTTFPIQLGDTLTNPGSTNYVSVSIQLPVLLADRNDVRIRWRIIADATGSTGTFRIDDVTVTIQPTHDLSLKTIRFSPPIPIEEDSIRAFALVGNVGLQVAPLFLVHFYNDLNNDSLPQPNEWIASATNVLPLAVTDSVEVSVTIGLLNPGERLILAQLLYQPDQNPLNDRKHSLLRVGYRARSVVVNEIMYAPTDNEPEWVELCNTRFDSINIKDWLISDNNVATRKMVSASSVYLPPRSFVILTKDSVALADVHPGLPCRIINIPSMPTLNNTGDAVVLFDNRNLTMDSLTYFPTWGGNTGGKSLERVDPLGQSTSQMNWSASRSINRRTPGRKNSVTRKDLDIALDTLVLSPQFPLRGDSVIVSARIINPGLLPASSILVSLYDDVNLDSIPQPQELKASFTYFGTILPLDSATVSCPEFHPEGLEHSFIVRASVSGDEDTLNNRSILRVQMGIPRRSVVINEIMYNPASEPEWIELYNTTAESVDVKGWKISNRITSSRYTVTPLSAHVLPHGYAVMTKDTALLLQQHQRVNGLVIQVPTLPTFFLNNSGDAVVMYDGRGATMDSLGYLPSWGGNTGGRSLERIDPASSSTAQANWSTSRQSTPGRKNSVTRKEFDLRVDTLEVSPLFPVHGDSIVITLKIRNPGFQVATSYSVMLYDDANADSLAQPQELVYSHVRSVPLEPLDSLLFTFVPYEPSWNDHILIGAISFSPDEDSLNNSALAQVTVGYRMRAVVISEVMYSPINEPEWVELYNTTAESIDVRGWKISNRSSTSRYEIALTSVVVPPRRYAVVTKDSAFLLQRHPGVPGIVLQVPSLPTFLFNNSGDAALVFDGRDFQMDSMRYAPGWGGSGGLSLERIDLFDSPGDSTNWSSSIDSMRATPGRENSIGIVDHDLQALMSPVIMVPSHEPVPLSITVKNVGRMASSGFDIAFFDDQNRDSVAHPEELVSRVRVVQSLARRETIRVSSLWSNPPSGIRSVIALVEYNPDLRASNNSAVFTVKIGYEARSVVINEIMYAPFTNDAEYVELQNISAVDVNLSGWKLFDKPSTSGSSNEFTLTDQHRVLPPGEYFVIASDSSFFSRFRPRDSVHRARITVVNQSNLSLNNDGDAVVIRDAALATIDSVAYAPRWHNPAVTDATGRSLERINPSLISNDARAWSTCVLEIGGTPGQKNSVFAATVPAHARLTCSPNPFSPDGDGHEDFAIIHYELPANVTTTSLRVYDVKGRLIRHLINNEPSGAFRDVVWDGNDDEKQRARIGMYIVLVEGLNEGGGRVYSAKGVVVLAAKL